MQTLEVGNYPAEFLLQAAFNLNGSFPGCVLCRQRGLRLTLSPLAQRNFRFRIGNEIPDTTALTQQFLNTLDSVTIDIEKVSDAPQKLHIIGAVITPPATTLHRPDLREFRFPEPQDMLRQIKLIGHLADSTKGACRFFRFVRVAVVR